MSESFTYKKFHNMDGVRVLQFRENGEKFQILKTFIHRPIPSDGVFDGEVPSSIIAMDLEDSQVAMFTDGEGPSYVVSGWSNDVEYDKSELEFTLASEGYFIGLKENS